MSIVRTHCPVWRSHWRSVRSDEPVTWRKGEVRRSPKLKKEGRANKARLVKVETGDRLRVAVQRPDARARLGRSRSSSLLAHHALVAPIHKSGTALSNIESVHRGGEAVDARRSRRWDCTLRLGEVEVPDPDLAVRAAGDTDGRLDLKRLDDSCARSETLVSRL